MTDWRDEKRDYEFYKAYDDRDICRYVGIGKIGRHKHVNSGKSHNKVVNAFTEKGIGFKIDVVVYENKTFYEMLDMEEKEIARLGRMCDGSGKLFNISPGGHHWFDVSTLSDEQKRPWVEM